jgi:integrase
MPPKIEVYETKRNGTRYRVRFWLDGRQSSKTFATPPEADQFRRDLEQRGAEWAVAELERDRGIERESTLDEWAEIHFRALTKPAPATVARYRRIYRQHWSPELGQMRLSTIERVHIAAALNKVTGSDKTILNAWGVLTHMLKMAAADGKIPRSPTIGVSPPQRNDHLREEHRYLTHAEFVAVIAATPEHWQPLVMMLGGTGMRWGEAAALTVGDVDLEQGVVRITKAEKQDPDHPSRTIVGPTKTKRSRRTVTLPRQVVAAIQPLTLGRKRTDRLFLPPNGGPLRHRTFYRDIWLKKSCANSGIKEPYPRLHDLRHSQAAWQIAAGTHPAVIQARLGHEKVTTTIDTYVHLFPDQHRQAAEAAAAVFEGIEFLALPQRPD